MKLIIIISTITTIKIIIIITSTIIKIITTITTTITTITIITTKTPITITTTTTTTTITITTTITTTKGKTSLLCRPTYLSIIYICFCSRYYCMSSPGRTTTRLTNTGTDATSRSSSTTGCPGVTSTRRSAGWGGSWSGARCVTLVLSELWPTSWQLDGAPCRGHCMVMVDSEK